MSVHTWSSGHIQGTWRNGNLGHGDEWDVVGEGSVKGIPEVSGWGTGEGRNAHPEREKLEVLCQARSWHPCLPLHSQGPAQLLAHRHSANTCRMAGGLRALSLRPQSRACCWFYQLCDLRHTTSPLWVSVFSPVKWE